MLINKEENAVGEMLQGLALAYGDTIEVAGNLVINKKVLHARRVTVVALCAAASEPAMSGYVGEGLVDVAVVGGVLAAPGPADCVAALKLADRGCGVLLVAQNQTGDVLTAKLALKQAAAWGLDVRLVLAHDDAGDPAAAAMERQGMLGCLPLCKLAGAAAAAGKTLDAVFNIAERFADATASIAVLAQGGEGLGGVRLAAVTQGTLQVGAGVRGEGGRVVPVMPTDELAEMVLQPLAAALKLAAGDRVLLLVSGSGAVTLLEQLILYRALGLLLAQQGAVVAAGRAGAMATVLAAAGVQVCLARMDDELLELWQAGCQTPYLTV